VAINQSQIDIIRSDQDRQVEVGAPRQPMSPTTRQL